MGRTEYTDNCEKVSSINKIDNSRVYHLLDTCSYGWTMNGDSCYSGSMAVTYLDHNP